MDNLNNQCRGKSKLFCRLPKCIYTKNGYCRRKTNKKKRKTTTPDISSSLPSISTTTPDISTSLPSISTTTPDISTKKLKRYKELKKKNCKLPNYIYTKDGNCIRKTVKRRKYIFKAPSFNKRYITNKKKEISCRGLSKEKCKKPKCKMTKNGICRKAYNNIKNKIGNTTSNLTMTTPNTIKISKDKILDNTGDIIWNNLETCYYTINRKYRTHKLAMFDFDNTLVTTFTGNILPGVKNTLRALDKDGYDIVIFSNQLGISKGKQTHEGYRKNIEKFLESYGSNKISVFYSTEKDIYRKPHTGMYELMKKKFDISSVTKNSFYCGDAAGRPTTKKRKKDFSNSDRLFAYNIKLPFYIPEEIIGVYTNDSPEFGSPMETEGHMFKKYLSTSKLEDSIKKYINKPLVIIMVGPQGSGKSTQASILSKKYNMSIVSQDISKSKSRAIRRLKQLLSEGKSVIIDNTHPSIKSRQEYLEFVPETYNKLCIWFDIDKPLSKHMIETRVQMGGKYIPDIAVNIYYSKFEKPRDDNYLNIVKINKILVKPNNELQRAFKMRYH